MAEKKIAVIEKQFGAVLGEQVLHVELTGSFPEVFVDEPPTDGMRAIEGAVEEAFFNLGVDLRDIDRLASLHLRLSWTPPTTLAKG